MTLRGTSSFGHGRPAAKPGSHAQKVRAYQDRLAAQAAANQARLKQEFLQRRAA